MRIAVFTNQFPSRVPFFARDMRALIRAGADLEVFTLRPIREDLWPYARQVISAEELPASHTHHLWMPSALGWFGRKARSRRKAVPEILKVSREALRFGPAQFAKTLTTCAESLGWLQRDWERFDYLYSYWGNHPATCAYFLHCYATQTMPFVVALRAHDLFYNQIYLREKLTRADRVILPGESHRDFFRDRFPDLHREVGNRLVVLAPGIDLDEFRYEPMEPQTPTLVAAGRLVTGKGHGRLLRAMHRLRQEGVSVRLRLLGDGGQLKKLQRLSRELGIDDRVCFTGWLYVAETRQEIRNATILVHPSSGLDSEPNTIKEAHALGTPVVGTTVAGIPEMLDHGGCGLLVPPGDVGALARAIRTYLEDAALRRSHARRARELCEQRYDVWKNGRRLKELLESTPRTPAQ